MPVIARSPEGKVVSLWGTALIRGADGQLRVLKVGDLVRKGDQILTTQNGIVQISNGDDPTPAAEAKAPVENDVDRAISELNAGDRQAAPAAGLTGGEGGSLEAALRVDRIAEPLGAGVLPRTADEATVQTQFDGTGTAVAEPDPVPGLPALGAPSSAISAAEEGATTNLGLRAPTGPAVNGSIRVDQVPAVGEIHKADGTLVTPGTVLTPADLPGLVYVPPADYDGVAPVGNFSYTLTADGQSVTGGTSITLVAVNDAPVATPATLSGNEDTALPVSLGGTDVDGRIVGVTVTSIPAGATLLLADGVTPVLAGQTLTPDQAATLLFRPAADFSGNQTLLFTVTDNGGAVSAPAAVSMTVVAVNDLPVPLASSGGSGSEDSPVAVRLGGTDVDGTVTSVTVTTLPANGTLYLAGGVTPVVAGTPLTPAQAASLVFVPNPDFNGNVSIGFTVTDNDGATSAPATAVVTVAPVNDAPVAAPDSATFDEDTVATGNVLGNDGDVDGPSLSVASFVFGGVSFPAGSTAIVGGVGTLLISTDGSWTFTPAANFNGPVPAIQVTTTDGSLSATSTLSLTVTPVNDAPLAQDDLASTPINTPATIAVLANDRDVEGEALTVTGASLANPSQGTVTVNPDGTLGFAPALNFTGTATITYTVRDASGASSTATVSVNVGNNTAPDGADVTRSLPEDGSYTVQAGDFGFSDADAGQTLASVRIDSLPAAGTLLLNGVPVTAGTVVSLAQLAAGDLVFAPASNGNGAPYASFGFSVQDSSGGFDTTPNTFRFDVTPVNDAPVAAVDTASTNEDTALTLTPATLLANDSDVDGDTLTITSVQGAVNGTVALVGGNVVFTPAANYNGPASFTYTVTDGNGSSATAIVNLTINAVGDAAVISSGTGSVTEDVGVAGGSLSTGGTLIITDPDAGEASFQAQSVNGAYGSFTLGTDGVWAYTASNGNPAIQALGSGDTLTETFTVRSVDGTTATVVVTINGTNDAAVISAGTGAVTEDVGVVGANIATGGTLTVTDIDSGQASFQAQASTVGTYGTFTLAANGAWTYTASNANPAIQALGAGQTLTETFTVTSADGTTSSVVVTINGTNDAAVISAGTGSVTEDVGMVGGNIATSGTLTVTDVDSGQAAFQAQASTAGTYGIFTLGTNGVWTYTALNSNPAVQALGIGQTLTETFTVRSTDGTTSTVVVTINGTNDAAVISAGTGSVTEDVGVVGGNIATGGTLTVTDVDAGQASFQAQASTAGTYGTFTLGANGVWSYTALNSNPAVQALGAGQTLTETFTVRSTDGTTSSVVVTINGTNDAAVISAGTGSVTEDVGVVGGNISTVGTLTVTDVDSGQAAFQAQASTAGTYGTFTLGTNGAWTYTASNSNPAVQALGAGQTLTETFTVRSTDGTASTVVVTINGTNDAAVISAGTGSVTEDVGVVGGNIATGGTLTVTDVDAGQASFQAQASTAGTYGTFTLGTNGAWTYTALNTNPAVQALGVGQTLTETFTVRSTDGTTSTVVVTINGTNDAAVISAGTGSVTEDIGVVGGNISTGGTLTVTDVDAGQASFQAQASTAGTYGTFTLGTDGTWTYTASNSSPAVQALGAGQTLTETFTVRSTDGTTSSVVVTINGTNDAAVISAGTGSVAEDVGVVGGNISTGGTLTVTDVDAGQASFQAQASTAGTYGTFTLGTNGDWTYSALNSNPAVQALGVGQTLTETFTVRSTDGTTSTVVVTINGTNDAAVISAGTGSVTEDVAVTGGNISTGGTLTVTDVDAGQASFQAQASTAGTYGTFTLGTSGAWTYTASNSTPAVQALGVGQTLTETFSVTSSDGTTSSVVVTINGTNDGPVAQANALITDEDTALTIAPATLLANDSDVDGDTLAIASVQDAVNGTVALVGGNVVFTPAPNYNGPASFTYTITDGNGGASTATVSLTVNAVNDAPTANADTASTAINTALPSIAVLANDTDADGDTLTVTSATLANPALGTVSINPDGTLAFTPALNVAGAVAINYTISDGHGGTSSATLSVNVGANTPPTGTDVTVTIAEDGSHSFTAADFGFADADLGQTLAAVRIETLPAAGTLTLGGVAVVAGQVINAADFGQLAYAPAPNASGNGYAGFTFSVQDSAGAFDATPNSVTVNVTPVPDAAVISGVASGATVEDTTLTTSGQLLVTDPDAGEAGFQPQFNAAGTYGSLSIDASGAWTYTLNNADPVVQSLSQGETRTESFTVRSIDGTPQLITITVTGTNDAAVISAGSGAVTEDIGVVGGNIATGGTLTVMDVDAGQAAFQAQASTAGTYGTFTLGTNGAWTYTASNSNPAVQALGAGQTLTETFTVRSTDGTTSSVVVTINGTNDAAVISAGTGSVTEDVGVVGGNIATGGTLTVTDVDSGQAAFQAQASTAGTYGTFTLGTNGAWTYTASNSNPAVQALGAGQTLTETFTVRSTDGTTSTVVVTINGTNDAAVISAGAGSVTEDVGVVGGNISTGGTLTVTDVDAGQSAFQAQAATTGTYGTFTLGTNGAWTYTASNSNPAVQALGAGQTLTETFTVRSTDGTTSTVVVTINGTNDAAVISAGTGAVTEDVGVVGGNIATGGTLTVTDVDAGQASFQAQASTAGAYGTFTLGTNGAWTYTASNSNPAVQALGAGQTLTETFTVRSTDGTTSTVVVTINGTNDAAVISAGTGSVTEDVGVLGGNIATGGTLTVTDVDSGQAAFQAQASTGGTYGTFTLGTNGAWTYTALNSNPAVQALGVGQTLTETFTVRSTDGTTSTVVVTINGTNDVAVISAGTGAVTEDVGVVGGNIATGGTLTVTDVDAGQASFQAQAATAGTYGTFTLGNNGAWTYTASNSNPAVQALGVGQTLTETFTVRSTDGTTSTVVVTINGTNDAAVISAGTGAVTEDVGVVGGNISTGGTLTVTDVDAGQASFQAQASTAGAYGTFTLGANGAWTYTASNSNPAVQALGAGQTLTETFTVRSTDGTTSTVVVTINGTNDAAVISAGAGSVTEDVGVVGGNISTGGTLTVTDVDAGQSAFQAQAATTGTYGTFTLGTNGAWTYTASNSNPAVQALGAGQTLTETFTVRSTDGTTSSVVVTINGTNDAAVISAGTGSVTEDVGVVGGNISTGGTLTVTDIDSGQASFQAQAATAGTYGTFTLGTNGVWTYTALNSNPAVQALGAGQTLTETFTVRSTDGTTSTVVVTINGTNDAAVISAGTGAVTEDVGVVGGNIATGGTLTVTDVDAGQASFQAQASTAGTYGTFTLGANGVWSYTALNSNPAVQALGAGQTLTETFTVRSTDGTTSTVVVTINGTNDAAVISAGAGSVTEDVGVVGGNIATGGTLTVTDVDAGQASFQAQASTAGAYGTFTLGTNGAWTYTASNSNPAVQALGAGQTLTETFTVRSTDGTTSTVVVTINGTNDAAVISAGTGAVTEDVGVVGGNIATGGTLTVTDVDSGQASFQAQASTAGTYGTFTLGTNGAWTYTALNSNPAVQALGVGQTLTETFTVRSTDGTASTVVVTINGTNDAAVISAGTGSVTEDVGVVGGNIATGGTLTVTDVDSGQASFQAQASTAGTYGTFTLGTNGVWTYSALNSNPAVQALGVGQTLTESFTVRSTDGTTSTVVVTINGTNDAAVISAGTGSVTEDVGVVGGNISTGGTLTVTDVDSGQAAFQAQASTAGTYGTFTLGTNGAWTYTALNSNPAVQALGVGQTLTETFTVRSTDGTTSTVVVTINGTNDAPVAQAASFTVAEDAAIVNGTVTATDIDNGGTHTFALTGAAPAGLTFNSNGTYSFNPANAAYQSLAAGQTQTITVPYTVTDNAGATSTANLVITVTGVNDTPTIGGPLTGTVREDTTLTATGTLTITDADAGQSAFNARTAVAGTYGSFSITTGGVWTYTLANAAANVQALPAGSSVTDSFVVTSADGTSRTVVVTVNGINDAPVAQAASFTVAEDAAIVNGTVIATDVDTGSTLSFALNGAAPAGLTFNSNGSYSFNPANAAYQSLAVGQSQVITVPYTVTDNTGATSTANLVITVNGTNDAPVANVNTVAATEDTVLTIAPATLLGNDTDVDSGDVLSITSVQGAVGGTVSLVGGNVVFTPTANFSGAGSFTYTVSDGHGGTSTAAVNVNIAAVADAPTLVINTATSTSGTVTSPALPPSTGLTRAFYDNIASVDTSNAGNISTVENAVENAAPTSSAVVTNVALATIGQDDAYRYTGYIFLQAGNTYTISGSRDDTLMVKLGGSQVYGVGYNNYGSFSATAFTPAVSGYYSIEVTAYNGDGPGDLDINMSVNGAAAVDLSTANFSLYANASGFAGGTVSGPLVPNNDGGYFPAVYKVGNEDTAIRLGSISAGLVDTDGSETLSVSVGSIPAGAVLSDGIHTFTASAGSTSVDVTGWALNDLTLTPPSNFSGNISLNVSATATEAAGGSATTQSPLVVVVTPTVDAPVLAGDTTIVTMAQGSGGQSTVNLPVLATLVDTDGSETLSVAISGVPTGATFNHGTSTGNGVWTFGAADLADLTLTLPAGYSTTGAPLTVTVASTETATGSADSVSSTITLIADYTTSTTGGANNNANTLSGNGANNLIDGQGGDDNISGNAGNDYIIGGAGNDTLNGGTGNDVLLGGIGNDIILGGTGSDLIRGGAGNDTLTGGATAGAADATADVFAWSLADAGTAGARATDTITDFNVGAVSAGGDVLDLRDLLSGDVMGAGNTAGNLINFMEFEVSTTGGVTSTTIHISSTGQFAGGVYVAGQEDQAIVLQGVNLPAALGLGAGATDSQILQELLTRGKLIVDSAP